MTTTAMSRNYLYSSHNDLGFSPVNLFVSIIKTTIHVVRISYTASEPHQS
jgi:hypothetical protein